MNRAAVITVEKAAAAKIFFECHYNELLSSTVTPRALRRRELEGALYEDVTSCSRAWARRETNHLRELRTTKSRTCTPECCDQMASMYEVVKVLGKGSFGVMRLAREKVTDRFVSQGISIRFREATNGDVVPLEILKETEGSLRNESYPEI